MASTKITLPSGAIVTIKDPSSLRVRDRNRVIQAGDGRGPNRGTGNLLTSMTYSSSRRGFLSYTAEVGAGAVYARQLEYGGGKWLSGVKYPYMEPALTSLVSSGQLSQILAYSYRPLGGQ